MCCIELMIVLAELCREMLMSREVARSSISHLPRSTAEAGELDLDRSSTTEAPCHVRAKSCRIELASKPSKTRESSYCACDGVDIER